MPDVPPQTQDHPGTTSARDPRTRDSSEDSLVRLLLPRQRAMVTGGDSGSGRGEAGAT